MDFDIFSPPSVWRLTKTSASAHTNLPISIQKSPRIVPGFESNGLVSPNIIRPVRTMSLPSHTFVKKECRLKNYQTCILVKILLSYFIWRVKLSRNEYKMRNFLITDVREGKFRSSLLKLTIEYAIEFPSCRTTLNCILKMPMNL